jgi:hypothetical protein
MTFTHEQIRAAILRAADRIEREPASYNFCKFFVPNEDGCGTQACMWGWIGFELGLRGASLMKVARACDVTDVPDVPDVPDGCRNITGHLYSFCVNFNRMDDGKAHEALRAYANKYFPATNSTTTRQPVVSWSDCAWKPSRIAS